MMGALDPNVEVMQWVFNSTMDKLTIKDDALEVILLTLKEHIEKFKEELVICKADLGKGMLDTILKQYKMDVPKPKGFKGTRFARNFKDGLNPSEKQELCRLAVKELTKATIEAEFFVELDLKKDKFESSKPKETSNGGGGHWKERDKNDNDGNGKSNGYEKPCNGKLKPNDKSEKLVKCFVYCGSNRVRDCPQKIQVHCDQQIRGSGA
ncbi:hypothetical protein PVK06_031092 [Gossypium arboreum]|uniref:Uncharacterized protein n=1 Tax=Gossypium arboreum TaxID=29729 RepID=A0ABR0NQ27_GOSAR|nr:hypothetical protein PVK06_031092 [Gossypium arboreum]